MMMMIKALQCKKKEYNLPVKFDVCLILFFSAAFIY